MNVIRYKMPLKWGALDLPLFGISTDSDGCPINPPAAWSLALDSERLWFAASHSKPASLHPESRPGRFVAGLWQHDVAELFLADPKSGRYIELNLSPNGAWWSCEFTEPRKQATSSEVPIPEVATFAELSPDGSWVAAMSIPLDLLKARIDFGETTRANVCFILESPKQRFLTTTDLGDGGPDFHQPDRFKALTFIDGDSLELPGRD